MKSAFRVFLWLFACGTLTCRAADVTDEYRIGVLSFRDKAQTLARWQPTADELGKGFPSVHFRVVAMDHAELDAAVAQRQVQFVITNPEHYIRLESLYGVTRIATLVQKEQGVALDHLASAIVVRTDRKDIAQLSSLKGKTVAAVAPFALGAYLMQAGVLLDAGIDARTDLQMQFLGLPQDRSIAAVMAGQADAAFVRAGMVEQMVREQKLPADALKVIARRDDPGFPLAHSTPLYPEWPLAVLPATSRELANRVAAHLLLLPPDAPAARAGHYHRWTVPVSYEPVESLMRRLGAPPFDQPAKFSIADVMKKYSGYIALILFLAAGAFLVLAVRCRRLSVELGSQIALVSQRSNELEHEMAARQAAEAGLRLQANVFENAQECLLVTDPTGLIVAINDAALHVTGYRREELLGVNPRIFKSGLHDDDFYRELWQAVIKAGYWSGEVTNRRKDGTLYTCMLKVSVMRDEAGRVTNYIGTLLSG
jgi:PAS domain S-box-containing protein